ncbi:hypothetical protein GDO81_029796, partial [Engystomops pustulosus]
MSRDEFQNRELDEEAQLLLAIQMSMDTRGAAMEDEDLQRALQQSLRDQDFQEEEVPLQRALEMSLRHPWADDGTSSAQEEVGDEMAKALDIAQLTVLAGDETSLVVACAALRKAISGNLSTMTLDGVHNFPRKMEILSSLEKKHQVTITEYDGQVHIQGFLQQPQRCQEELSQILKALHVGDRLVTLQPQQMAVLIPVAETSEEYTRVVRPFLSTLYEQTSDTEVLQVQKVQNPLLYNQYQLKKQSLRRRSPQTAIERTLYHGTTEDGAKEICHQGFNRSFCGKNGKS